MKIQLYLPLSYNTVYWQKWMDSSRNFERRQGPENWESVMQQRIFMCWFGSKNLPKPRQRSLDLFRQMDCEIIVVNEQNFSQWLVESHPIPDTWKFLSPVHKTNYLIAYLLHYHGGGHADFKPPTGSWVDSFQLMQEHHDLWAVGYPETRWAVSNFGVTAQPRYQPSNPNWWKYRFMQLNYKKLIGNCGFIFRPQTPLTLKWLKLADRLIYRNSFLLKKNPAKYAKERPGEIYDGLVSKYPIEWSSLAGDLMQPLILKYHRRVIRTLPYPDLNNYQ